MLKYLNCSDKKRLLTCLNIFKKYPTENFEHSSLISSAVECVINDRYVLWVSYIVHMS